MMGFLDNIIANLPEVKPPTQKKLSFNEKLRWTGMILIMYFILGLIPAYGLAPSVLSRFDFLSTILGASFGSLTSLGIGPIVTASIVLQLVQGSGLINFDLTSETGKRRFQGLQKILSIFFIFLEAIIFVTTGALPPTSPNLTLIVIVQLAAGGLFILFMDEIVSKYGFGSGVSLFIAAGVSQSIFIQLFNPLMGDAQVPAGAVIAVFYSLGNSQAAGALTESLVKIIATVLVYLVVVYVQAMKVEIPLSFGRVSGQGIRWPLNFLYSNVIPIILVSALIANFQLLGQLIPSVAGISSFIRAPNVLLAVFQGGISGTMIVQATVYMLIYMVGATIFSIFWVQTSGLDAASQAEQMISSGLQIPGFRRDKRVLERMLKRYITPLTVMGGLAIGILATLANITGAIGTGTGLLLTVMIIYQLYQDIAKQHMYDMNPMMRKFIKV